MIWIWMISHLFVGNRCTAGAFREGYAVKFIGNLGGRVLNVVLLGSRQQHL